MPKLQAKVDTAPKNGTPAGSVGRPYLSGHCEIADRVDAGVVTSNKTSDELHATCRGAITNGVGTTWLCRCDCHVGALLCHRCGYDHSREPDGYDPERRICTDTTDCADKIRADFEVKRRTDPLLVAIEEARKAGAEDRAAREAEKARRRAEEAERARERGEEPPTSTKAGKTPQKCHCGCGEMTKGGRFLMGHDMKLKGSLFRVAREGVHQPSRVRCTVELLARGWSIAGISDEVLNEARERYRDLGETKAIQVAVDERYGA